MLILEVVPKVLLQGLLDFYCSVLLDVWRVVYSCVNRIFNDLEFEVEKYVRLGY